MTLFEYLNYGEFASLMGCCVRCADNECDDTSADSSHRSMDSLSGPSSVPSHDQRPLCSSSYFIALLSLRRVCVACRQSS